jgi:hypothetical protein
MLWGTAMRQAPNRSGNKAEIFALGERRLAARQPGLAGHVRTIAR